MCPCSCLYFSWWILYILGYKFQKLRITAGKLWHHLYYPKYLVSIFQRIFVLRFHLYLLCFSAFVKHLSEHFLLFVPEDCPHPTHIAKANRMIIVFIIAFSFSIRFNVIYTVITHTYQPLHIRILRWFRKYTKYS